MMHWNWTKRECREGWDKRAKITMKKKCLQVEREPHPDWQSVMVSDGEPAQDIKKESGKLV